MKNKSWDALPLGCFSSLPNLPALAGSGSVCQIVRERIDVSGIVWNNVLGGDTYV